jgi:hypothetical protein
MLRLAPRDIRESGVGHWKTDFYSIPELRT